MYYLIFLGLYLISLLPMPVLYILSYISRLMMFNVMGYRKKVITQNISAAFPQKNTKEIAQVIKDFEQAFCDQWFEVIKMLSCPRERINKMVEADWAVFIPYFEQNRNVHVFLGHQFNWELANLACQLNTFQPFYGIYLPLSSQSFNRLMSYIRQRVGSQLVNAQELRSDIKPLMRQTHILGVIADQSSNNLEASYWYRFLNRPCPFTFVPEKTAKLMKSAVYFASTHRISKGRYRIEFTKISDDASKELPGVIMDEYVTLLERSIENQPHNWLWSHKRWKKNMPPTAVLRVQ